MFCHFLYFSLTGTGSLLPKQTELEIRYPMAENRHRNHIFRRHNADPQAHIQKGCMRPENTHNVTDRHMGISYAENVPGSLCVPYIYQKLY